MSRNINSDEVKDFIEWLYDEHDISFIRPGEDLSAEYIKALWDQFLDGE
ncbi:hypothetical protein CL65_gp063 [Mycobacterium phage Patience]|uniref:Uncharacterized protein n=1 Tax=Mycobacterium phage Patience TaxID=1074308 RepID=G1JWH3_9CAUD|nr:hypothetical protein CL65_gp063 [Mycobacterium phage Patience]AEL97971.1 hypothetical protein PATIENCE_62 [Mycobacterium phage Patience]